MALIALPGAALAHASPGGFVLLLPTGYWMAGGAIAVAASFALLAAMPGRGIERLFRTHLTVWRGQAPGLRSTGGWLSFAGCAVLVWLGLNGPRDPLANLTPLTIWTGLWVGLTLATAIFGNLWAWMNPWIAPYRLARRLGLAPANGLPAWAERLGHWPVVVGMAALGWFELVHPSPEDPALLARVLLAYWAVTFAMMLAAGDGWLLRGEVLSVFYRYIARLAPFGPRGAAVRLGPPGWRLLESPPLSLGAVVFISAALATVTFDGLAGSFFWLGLIGINPLDFPGRSAVVGMNTLGYLATIAALNGAFAGAIWLGRRLAAAPVPYRVELGRLALTLLPIALGYHASHYLTVLLVNGQYWVAALNDPFATGASWLGYDLAHVTTSFFYDPAAVRRIWQAQAGAVIAGHLLAVTLAHLTALDLHGGDRRRAVIGQIPLAVLMVLYTLLGLWLLATPRGV